MATYTRRILDFVLYSNLFIACCAGAQVALTFRLLSFPQRWDVVLLVVVSTMLLYSIPQALSKNGAYGSAKLRWTSRNRPLFLFLLAVSALVLLVLLFGLRILVVAGYILAGIIGLAYYVPLLGRKGHKEGLRSLYGAKVFYIALVWVLVCLGLPVLVGHVTVGSVPWLAAAQLALWIFVFVAAITIPFDIRDEQTDRRYGLKTLPVLIGKRRSSYLGVFLLAVHGLMVMTSAYELDVRLSLFSVSVCALLLVAFANRGKGDYFYFMALDGLLILQFLAVEVGGCLVF